MFDFQEKYTKHTKRQKIQFAETGQASQQDVARMLELSDWKFKTTMINMLRALVDKSRQYKNK